MLARVASLTARRASSGALPRAPIRRMLSGWSWSSASAAADAQQPTLRRRVARLATAGIVGTVVVGFGLSSYTTVATGKIGIVTTFGKVHQQVLQPGLHFINPLSTSHLWSIQTRLLDYTLSVPSQEGLMITVDASVQYRMDPAGAVQLFSTVGSNYEDVLVKPLVMSAIRAVSSSYDAKAFYTSLAREEMSSMIMDKLCKILRPSGIVIEAVPLRRVALPESLQRSIEDKMKADQENQRMEHVLKREQQEAERKAIEAKGIAEFQHTVTEGITPGLLQWKAIEATVKLAESTNAKVVVIGNTSTQGMPLILGSQS